MAYIGREPQIGNYQVCDAISVVNGQAAYTMQVSSVNVIPESVNHMIVSLNGVIQNPGSSYTISSSTITFSSNLATGDSIDFIYLLGNTLDLGTPSDDTVTGAKIVDNAINSEHYTDGSIDTAHIADLNVTTGKIAADAITGAKIADDAIDSEHYTDGSIDTAHIADANITKAKLADSVDIFAGTSLNAADLGSGIHIKTADSGGSVSADAGQLVIEGSSNAGLSILGGTGNACRIYFGDSGDNDIGQIRYAHDDNSLAFKVNALADALKIDNTGAVTKPLQPAVHAYLDTTQSNISTGFTTVQLNAEIYDVNSDFNTSTYTFTAPVTGKYLVTMNLIMTDVDTAFQWIYLVGVASNRNYYLNQIDPRLLASDGLWSWVGSSLVDMDANDTFIMKTRSSAHGAAQMDIAGGTATATETTMTMTLLS